MKRTPPPGGQEPCCGAKHGEPSLTAFAPAATTSASAAVYWIEGTVRTAVGEIPRASTSLRFADRLGAWRVRCGIGRMRHSIAPGLYAIGTPTAESTVLVSANYKLSFDRLRSQLAGRDAWILVLDTRGVNVWCAAGKGTFGTAELVGRVAAMRLKEVVTHKTLIAPQLGATGLSAHEVKRLSGFRVVYGPVRAEDLPAFLDNGLKATPEMRRVTFPLRDRAVLIPMETVGMAKITLLIAAGLLLLSGFDSGSYSLSNIRTSGFTNIALLLGAVMAGTILVPVLLPWLPGRPFAVKGAWVGFLSVLAVAWYAADHPDLFANWMTACAWLFFIPAVTSYAGMNFTGASTYTSLSGVLKEMRVALPLQIGFTVIAAGFWIAGLFV